MSRYGDKYSGDRYDSRRSSSSRRDSSPPRHRSRRSRSSSPSPGPSRPRDPEALPESFGRPQEARVDDDLSVLQRMRSSYESSPLHILYKYLENKDKVKIWTRNYKEVRGVMTGFIIAFDKHWNIVLSDVDEVFLKFKKCKTPFLRDVASNENLPDMPVKVPKKKSQEKAKPEPKPEPQKGESEKKRKRPKKPKATSEKRQSKMLFIRGDNIVIISKAVEDDEEEEEEEEEEEAPTAPEIKSESG